MLSSPIVEAASGRALKGTPQCWPNKNDSPPLLVPALAKSRLLRTYLVYYVQCEKST